MNGTVNGLSAPTLPATVERGSTVDVLDRGYVRLVDWMGDDLSVTNAPGPA